MLQIAESNDLYLHIITRDHLTTVLRYGELHILYNTYVCSP